MSKFDFTPYYDKLAYRAPTMKLAAELCEKRLEPIHCMVETGTMRKLDFAGDGCSTLIWSELAEHLGVDFYSVDINPTNIEFATANTKAPGDYVVEDSVEFLLRFYKPIGFLYLDSWDFVPSDPNPAQEHNLKEFKAAELCLIDKAVVLLDDSHGTLQKPGGKVGLTVPYMLSKGWKCLQYYHQALFVKQ